MAVTEMEIQQTNGNCRLCHYYRVDNECDQLLINVIDLRARESAGGFIYIRY